MFRFARVILLTILLFTTAAVKAQEMEIPDELVKLSQQYIAAKTPEEKVELCRKVLLEYHHIPMAMQEILSVYVDHMVDELDKPDEALEFLNGKFRALDLHPDIVHRLDDVIIRIHGRPGHGDRLAEHVAIIGKTRKFSTGDQIAIINAAAESGAWELLERHTRTLDALADPSSVKSEYAERNMNDEATKRIADRRKATVLTARGWALANSGKPVEALESFEEAASLVDRDYFGISRGNIDWYRGRTLALMGENDKAARALAPLYLYRAHRAAGKALREIHTASGYKDYETWLEALKLETAPRFQSFSLRDYSDSERKFEDVRGEVTVVSFWSTTCQKCMVELPALEPVYQAYRDKGLSIIAIEGNRDAKNARAFIERNKLSYTFLEDGSGENNMARRYLINALPTVFLIDSDNRIRYVHVGYSAGDEKKLEGEIRSVLGL